VVPHQANLRIIEAVAKRAGVPMERCFVNVQRYGNMSAATVPVALVEALEEERVAPGANLLLTGFGLMILALAVLGGRFREEAVKQPGITTKVAPVGH